jgi:aspartokinase/homoserine dehydrogenase 1
LLRQISNQLQPLAEKNDLDVKLVGVANSKLMLLEEEGIAWEDALTRLHACGVPSCLATFQQTMQHYNLPNSIFVDCTASEQVAGLYQNLLASNISVVTPNKKANSGSLSSYAQIRKTVRDNGAKFLYETNVCAGLPVINTLNDLLLSGDAVEKIEAVLSGTLNYIFSSFAKGMRFSEVVAEAKAKGYTEPDPRDDLSGMDVARKMLILAREAGLSLELSDVSVQSLVPDNCRGSLTPDEFIVQLQQSDDYFETLRLEAESNNQKLRYQASLQEGKIQVGLTSVDSSHPFYSLSGSDNIIQFVTSRYNDRPMVIRGPGAGAEVTAAGVFADIIRIGNNIR